MDNDLISRQAAIDALMVAIDDVGILDKEDIDTVFKIIPPAEQKTGKWIWDEDELYYRCSECGKLAYETLYCIDGTYKYCPFCGTKMIEVIR